MKKAIAILLSTILALALLVYSALRSLDFIGATLPPDKQILAWFALMATEGGLVLWLLYFLYGAAGAWQRGTALLMVVVDLVGAVALFTADTMFRSGEMGLTSALSGDAIRMVILAMSGIIAVNIAAGVLTHLTDPDVRKKQAAEEANDSIEELAIKLINQDAQGLAAELAPLIAADWRIQTRARFTHALGSGAPLSLPGQTIEGRAREPEPKPTRAEPAKKPFGWYGWRKRPTPAPQPTAAATPAQTGEIDMAKIDELLSLLKSRPESTNGGGVKAYASETTTPPDFLANQQESGK